MESNYKRLRVLITGVSGQDGLLMARHLVLKGHIVWGTSRDINNHKLLNLQAQGLLDGVALLNLNNENFKDVLKVYEKVMPNLVFNFSCLSSVKESYTNPQQSVSSIVISTLNHLEAIRLLKLKSRFFNPSSGECFSDTTQTPAIESTVFKLQSPYAISKSSASEIVRFYRNNYDLFASTGFLFNHESILRPSNYFSMKVIKAAYEISIGAQTSLDLGNLSIVRDIGLAYEFIPAMFKILLLEKPGDFIISTGKGCVLLDFVKNVFIVAGLDWQKLVKISKENIRKNEAINNIGNPALLKSSIGWNPVYSGLSVGEYLYSQYFKFRSGEAKLIDLI